MDITFHNYPYRIQSFGQPGCRVTDETSGVYVYLSSQRFTEVFGSVSQIGVDKERTVANKCRNVLYG